MAGNSQASFPAPFPPEPCGFWNRQYSRNTVNKRGDSGTYSVVSPLHPAREMKEKSLRFVLVDERRFQIAS